MKLFQPLSGFAARSLLIHVLLWLAVLLLPLFTANPENDAFPYLFDLLAGFLHLLLFYFIACFLYPRFMTRRLWWLFFLFIAAQILLLFRFKSFMLVNLFPEIRYEGYMDALIGFPLIFFSIAAMIYRVVVDQISYEKRLKEQQAERLATELKFLRSQISPHFLFNVLNNLVSMARHRSEQLEPSLIRLAGLMRYMLYESEAKKVSLAREIEYLESYIALQKVRFEGTVEIRVIFPKLPDSWSIEPMLLIPFVENAFKHGLGVVDAPYIDIRMEISASELYFSVENNYSPDPLHTKDADSGIGLANSETRLELLYPGRHELLISDHGGIFRVELKVIRS